MENNMNGSHAHDVVLLKEWIDLRNLMLSRNCIIAPSRFVKTVQQIAAIKDKDLFTGYAQNDLPEFLLFILDCFHNALSHSVKINVNGDPKTDMDKLAIGCYTMIRDMYAKDYSHIIKLFSGISVTIIKCPASEEILSTRPEPFLTIDLPVLQTSGIQTLDDCFNAFCNKERMDGENMWFNENTNSKQVVDQQVLFWKLPDVMIITFKRFTNAARKISCLVEIPLTNIDMSHFVVGYNKGQYIYDVTGVCNHHGSVYGGHYTANVLKEDKKWYNFNDAMIKEIPKETVITNEAYCLFLKKKPM
tara:strand:- start:293 stop:1201 length:909 start_codon:yes stop_codon:yes gene_type:complete